MTSTTATAPIYILVPYQRGAGRIPFTAANQLAYFDGLSWAASLGWRCRSVCWRRRYQHRPRKGLPIAIRWSGCCRPRRPRPDLLRALLISSTTRGHHVRVSTPEDPASARFGETLWEFLAVLSAVCARRSLAPNGCRLGVSPKLHDVPSNDVLNAWLMSVCFRVGCSRFGPALTPFSSPSRQSSAC